MKRAAVLASGKGSNLAALLAAQDAFPSYRIVLAVSNIEGCGALDVARSAAVEAAALPSRGVPREEHEALVQRLLSDRSIEMIESESATIACNGILLRPAALIASKRCRNSSETGSHG